MLDIANIWGIFDVHDIWGGPYCHLQVSSYLYSDTDSDFSESCISNVLRWLNVPNMISIPLKSCYCTPLSHTQECRIAHRRLTALEWTCQDLDMSLPAKTLETPHLVTTLRSYRQPTTVYFVKFECFVFLFRDTFCTQTECDSAYWSHGHSSAEESIRENLLLVGHESNASLHRTATVLRC